MMNRMARLTLAVSLAVPFAGCETLYKTPKVEVATPTYMAPPAIPVPDIHNGSIFQAAQYRPLFEDYRARLVGDSIIVQITETISATQTSTSTIDKTGKVTAAVTALPFITPNAFNKASAAGNSDNSFSGAGTVLNTNNFSGTITAVVTGVLPNGHLLIAGEKQIGVNQNVDVLRFSGQVDPHMIQSGNTVVSSQIANVRIEQRGRGAQADAQGIGWLSRFFLNVLPI
jgi:flagellar L-ring protein precursor FlgH